jgi:Zn-finger nucleic acid-binding protein
MSEEECPICHESFNENENVAYTKCKHKFHTSCIGKLINELVYTCPLCRTFFMDETEIEEFEKIDNLDKFFEGKVYNTILELNLDINFIKEVKHYYNEKDKINYIKTINDYNKINPLGLNVIIFLLKLKI